MRFACLLFQMFLFLLPARGISWVKAEKSLYMTIILICNHNNEWANIFCLPFISHEHVFFSCVFFCSITFSFLPPQWMVMQHISGPTGKPDHMFTYLSQQTGLSRVWTGSRGWGGGGSTVAYQQASAVPKPPAAIFSSQHEGEGLTVAKKKTPQELTWRHIHT